MPPMPQAPVGRGAAGAIPLQPLKYGPSTTARNNSAGVLAASLVTIKILGVGVLGLFWLSVFVMHAHRAVPALWLLILSVVLFGVLMSAIGGTSRDALRNGPYSFGSFLRLLAHGAFSAAATVILLFSLLVTAAVVVDLPGLVNTGIFDRHTPHELAHASGRWNGRD